MSSNPMTAAEHRMGIQPLEELQAERADLVEKVATLRAQYGTFGTAEHLRKIELARIKGLIRAETVRDQKKGERGKSNDQIDDEAHFHRDYIEFVARQTVERAQWVRLEEKINDIDAVVMRGQAIARFAASERMQP